MYDNFTFVDPDDSVVENVNNVVRPFNISGTDNDESARLFCLVNVVVQDD